MKHLTDAQRNDHVIRQALKGNDYVFIAIDQTSGFVITGPNGGRPLYFSVDLAAEADSPHQFVRVDPHEPLKHVTIEEIGGKDRWVYRPAVEIDFAKVEERIMGIVAPKYEESVFAEMEAQDRMAEANGYTPNDQVTATITVRHSELVDAASCLKRYQLAWIKNLRPKRTDSKLTIGSMFHAFQEAYEPALAALDGEYVPKTDPLQHGMRSLHDEFNKFRSQLAEIDAEGRAALDEACIFVTKMCEWYHLWRTTDPVGMDLSAIQQPEATFNLEVGVMDGVRVVLSGTMDGAGVTRVTTLTGRDDTETYTEEALWLREYKTCQSIADKLKQYRVDKQTRRYVGAMRKEGIHFMGVELVLAAKALPLEDEDFILKDGTISADKSKWAKATVEQAHRIAALGKFVPQDAKKGLTEQGFHDILKMLEGQPNRYFHVERLFFNEEEIATIMEETLIEGHRLHVTRETASRVGDRVFTRNQGPMGFNCKSCSVRDLCEMELKGVDTTFHVQEHFVVDDSIHSGKEMDDTDD